ncbi:Acetoacetyl-CoA synthetase [Mycena kentingensis (nom. inval.)]|nr:Acetoacetyl-CoA synthetase [Mycena kentingensis (nom. inval.)]
MAALYVPHEQASSATFRFKQHINAKYNLCLSDYQQLYHWSTNNLSDFWSNSWDFCNIIGYKGSHVVDPGQIASNPAWFKDARVNWAENMLRERSSDKLALQNPRLSTPHPPHRRATYAQLYSLVARIVSALLANGVKPGDRIASYASNSIEVVALCLATASIGAIWVSAASDFGPEGVLERFAQVQPKFLFAVSAVAYNAKVHDHLPKVAALLEGLGAAQPKAVIFHALPFTREHSMWRDDWVSWDAFLAQGRPKAIVHRAGGMLLQSQKELQLCADLQPSDVFFYYTTTGWMMWNFLVAGLAVGCTLVLYDGSPLRNPAYLWNLTDELAISIFGTSAKYIEQLSKGYKPREHHDLKSLRHIYSTGSPLSEALFSYVYRDIHPNVLLGSITGGTDICSLFAGMNSALPVYRGEIQCRMLGMAVESYSDEGKLNPPDVPGELVALKPFPCMPAGFWPLEGFSDDAQAVAAAKARYQQAYFADIPRVWYHGDHICITRSRAGNGGGMIMRGRSDGVLNPGGVRFGSSELYDVIEAVFPGIIVDSLAVGQKLGEDERVILFVKLPDGKMLDAALEKEIRDEVRVRRSARHVPGKIVQVRDIPYTLNLKKVEVLVGKIINGAPLTIVNKATLANADALDEYEHMAVVLTITIPQWRLCCQLDFATEWCGDDAPAGVRHDLHVLLTKTACLLLISPHLPAALCDTHSLAMPSLFLTLRASLYGAVFVATLICLAMAGHFQSVLAASDLTRFVPFALFVSSAGLLVILALLGCGLFLRERSPISARLELASLGFLGILWLALGIFLATSDSQSADVECFTAESSSVVLDEEASEFQTDQFHAMYHVLTAFSLINAVLVLLAFIVLLTLVVRRHMSGDSHMWYGPVSAGLVNNYSKPHSSRRRASSKPILPTTAPVLTEKPSTKSRSASKHRPTHSSSRRTQRDRGHHPVADRYARRGGSGSGQSSLIGSNEYDNGAMVNPNRR